MKNKSNISYKQMIALSSVKTKWLVKEFFYAWLQVWIQCTFLQYKWTADIFKKSKAIVYHSKFLFIFYKILSPPSFVRWERFLMAGWGKTSIPPNGGCFALIEPILLQSIFISWTISKFWWSLLWKFFENTNSKTVICEEFSCGESSQ